ncbi:MAG: replication-relaxation family protein [Hyphomicrobium sp.]|uniref:replication-relaxation family protein n=1 Tax=Hyphomicrobium sp. TaxID=82 RepID=UPI001321D6AE|nr:replication-relaxation family protein [Hyphomicrobium sp.]KAB2943070.1 MAG: hypothetical protein F9K20_03315 [Hyphomicrobium sp.]MBZ0208945.1 replication-relaxation family protein [Hyphomicrobium sp.]
MEIQVTERRSRTRRKKTGVNIALSPDFDVRRILLPLYRHGKLPTAYLLAFRGGSYTAGRNRLTKLYHETAGENAHLIHRISPNWRYINPLYRDELYDLGEKGEDILRQAGLIGEYQNPLQQKARMREMVNLPHAVMISTTTASIELAAQKFGTHRFFSWDEVLEHMQPEHLDTSEVPFAMQADIGYRFDDRLERKSYKLIPDGVFVLKDQASSEAVGFAVEAENRKQSGASNLMHTSFLKTFLGYRSITRANAHRPIFGEKTSLMVLVVTRSQRKIEEMKKIIMQATDNKGSALFCFRHIPVLGSPEAAPKPDQTLFTGAWERAGHPPFYLHTLSDKPHR